MRLRQTGEKKLLRDEDSGAIVNSDLREYEIMKMKRRRSVEEADLKKRVERLESRLQALEESLK